MKINRIEIRKLSLPLHEPWFTSTGKDTEKVFLLVTVITDEAEGYGECVAMRGPFYSEETTDTAWHILNEHLVPRVMDVELQHPSEVRPLLAAVRGNRMAKSGLETAIWDAWAKENHISLAQALGGTKQEIEVGVSIGIQVDMMQLLGKIETALEDGYKRIKIKIKPGWDLEVVSEIRRVFGKVELMVDANSAYTLDDLTRLKELDQYDLTMIEQPLGYDDIYEHSVLQQNIRTPICLDESIRSLRDLKSAIAMQACKIVNLKIGRVGGFSEARDMQALCLEHGVAVWCGGMLESGVGRLANIALTSLPGFTLPGDTAPSAHYFTEDIIEPSVMFSRPGFLKVPDGEGIGAKLNMKAVAHHTVRAGACNRR